MPRGWLEQAPVTRALLTMNVAVFVVQLVLTAGRSLMHLPTREALAFGASYSLATLGEQRWETLVTACFLHDGVLHLGFNMLVLWQAGPLVERNVGSARMAPMYIVAGIAGNLLSVISTTWLQRTAQVTVGASGAISGVLAAAFVVGWRVQGWKGPLTQAMLRWLVFVIVFGILSRVTGSNIDNAAHMGGALAGGIIAAMWRRGYRYPESVTRVVVGASGLVLAACIGIVGLRDQTDPFATMDLKDRDSFTTRALMDGSCRKAHDGLLAVERLRRMLAPVARLRERVESECGHVGDE
ncbi:MAG TPA: rhomboid family intramembrane serine protease [Polyangiaceae bacterium]